VSVEAGEGLEATVSVIYQVVMTEWDCGRVLHAVGLEFFGGPRLCRSDGGRHDRSVDLGLSCTLVGDRIVLDR
jgi:hypothetical protein